jgi:hypothetical protein
MPNISTSGNIVFGPNIYLNAPVGLPKGVYSVRIYSNDNYKINKTVRILKVD